MDDSTKPRAPVSNSEHPTEVAPDGLPYMMTVQQVARQASLGQSTVRKAIRDGHLNAIHYGVGVRVPREDFLFWVKNWSATTEAAS